MDADEVKDLEAMTLGPGLRDGGPKTTAYGAASVDVGIPEVAEATSVTFVLGPLQNTPARGISDANDGVALARTLLNVLIAVPLSLRVAGGATHDDHTSDDEAVVSDAVEFWNIEAGAVGSKASEDSLTSKLVEVELVLLNSGAL
jgi:hypothetical protein